MPLVASLLAPLWSCSYGAMLDKIAPKEDVEFAKSYLSDLRAGHFEEVEKYLSPELVKPETRAALKAGAGQFPPGEPTSVELIGAHVVQGPDRRTADIVFQYRFEGGWVVASVLVVRKGGGLAVGGVHVNRNPESLQRINAFTLRGRGPVHYLFLAGLLFEVCFILVVLAVSLRTRGLRRKWLWAVFILFGVGRANVNWTTGQIGVQLISAHLLGVGAAAASPYSPWVVSVTFPLGAVAFLLWRWRARKATPEAAIPTAPAG